LLFVGIDWASEEHAVRVHDDVGAKMASFSIKHSAEGLDKIVLSCGAWGNRMSCPVAIEHRDGRLVDRLLEADHPAVAVAPNAIEVWREAEVVSGANPIRVTLT
jgi:hypothetical protein